MCKDFSKTMGKEFGKPVIRPKQNTNKRPFGNSVAFTGNNSPKKGPMNTY
jgi:hypothetical protein